MEEGTRKPILGSSGLLLLPFLYLCWAMFIRVLWLMPCIVTVGAV